MCSAPHQIKDSFVLIELRPVLFTELWQQFLCTSPFLYHLHCHSQKWGGGEVREGGRGIFQRTTWGFGHVSAININRGAGQKCLARSYTCLFEKRPLWCCYQAPSTDTGFGGFEVGCGNFTAFFDSSKLLQNATNVKKTKGALAAA